ncbi:MAG: GGDEF domain-containing protein [Pseudomonadales bacterium]|nr:GGDEF domain-containing protein [Pseudomonadales bacterium]MCP5343315.1 GGDEF domain-containing protein [Pseudomonadales bacterium]
MDAVQPLFFINILVGFTLALCLAYVAWGRERELSVWALAFALYPVSFLLFGFRAYLPEWVPIIVANSCLAVMFALFSEGLKRFYALPLPWWIIWGLTPVAILGFVLLQHDFDARNNFGALLTVYHSVVAIYMVQSGLREQQSPGRWIIYLAVMFSSLSFLTRAIFMVTGKGSMVAFVEPGVPQTILLSLGMVWLIMFAIGLLVSYKERAEREILRLALQDPLTQLGNRRALHERLQMAFDGSHRDGHHGAFIVLDLDCFKELNDTHGHALGDQLLVEVAYRLKDCVNDGDTVVRLGGDEFVLLVLALDHDKTRALRMAQTIAHRAREKLQQPYSLQKSDSGQSRIQYTLSVSIGGDLFQGHGKSREDLFRNADSAMYMAKEAGRNCVVFHGDMRMVMSGVA